MEDNSNHPKLIVFKIKLIKAIESSNSLEEIDKNTKPLMFRNSFNTEKKSLEQFKESASEQRKLLESMGHVF